MLSSRAIKKNRLSSEVWHRSDIACTLVENKMLDVEQCISQPFLRLEHNWMIQVFFSESYKNKTTSQMSIHILQLNNEISLSSFCSLICKQLKFQHRSLTLENFLKAPFMNIQLVILHYTKTSALNWDKTKELAQQCELNKVNQMPMWTTNDQELINWVLLWAAHSNRGMKAAHERPGWLLTWVYLGG